jgi:hypothetical protein
MTTAKLTRIGAANPATRAQSSVRHSCVDVALIAKASSPTGCLYAMRCTCSQGLLKSCARCLALASLSLAEATAIFIEVWNPSCLRLQDLTPFLHVIARRHLIFTGCQNESAGCKHRRNGNPVASSADCVIG